jgi:predicted dehydrogenase
MPSRPLSRRSFISLGAAASVLALAPRRLRAQASASDLRVAVVGLRIKGNQHVDLLRKTRGARVVAVCDADEAILGATVDRLAKDGVTVAKFVDYRRLLEQPDIDAVVIATPNHLHTLQAIMAMQAGKDAYVEKPVSHTVFEGRALAAAAARTGRIVQAGTQNRSDAGLQEAFAAIRAGELGPIKLVRGLCYRSRPNIGLASGPAEVPATLNLDFFCGPASLEVPRRKQFHYDWHWFWETGNGDIGNQGPHELDMCRWVLGETGLPRRVLSLGGRFGEPDDGQTPNTHLTLYDYASAPVLFEVRNLTRAKGTRAEDAYRGIRVGVVVECEGGYFAGGRGGGFFFDAAGKRQRGFPGDGGEEHMQNFVDAALARNPGLLRAPIAGAVVSTDLVHLGNLAYRSGGSLAAAEISGRLAGWPAAVESFGKLGEHLAANEAIDAARPWQLGGWLEWDAAAARFSGGAGYEQANQLLTRPYRAPWTLPVIA